MAARKSLTFLSIGLYFICCGVVSPSKQSDNATFVNVSTQLCNCSSFWERNCEYSTILDSSTLERITFGLVNDPKLHFLDLSKKKIKTIRRGAFQNVPQLHDLDLRNNGINFIEVGTFEKLPMLSYLTLANNSLEELPPASFYNKSLLITDLSRNKFKTIRRGVFGNVGYLDLSSNEIRFIEARSFENLSKDNSISLANNLLEEVTPDIFSNTNLKNIYLNSNKIKIIRIGALQNLQHLIELDLNNNEIKFIEGGSFASLLRLDMLRLNNNLLAEVTDGIFNDTNLSFIDLSQNKIKVIRKGAFQNLRSLETLNLTYNKINFIEDGSFKNVSNTFSLYLTNNSLDSIPKNIYNCKKLFMLSLMENKIRSIAPGAFQNSSIVYLNLTNNKLEEIRNGVFDHSAIQHLVLSSNKIREIEPNALDPIYRGIQLDFNELEIIKRDTFNHAVYFILLNNKNLKYIEPGAFNVPSESERQFVRLAPTYLKNEDVSSADVGFYYTEQTTTLVPTIYLEKNNSLDEDSRGYLHNLIESDRFAWYEHVKSDYVSTLAFSFDEKLFERYSVKC